MSCRLEWCDGTVHGADDGADDCTAPGAWHCVTCHKGMVNNLAMWRHRENCPGHVVGWSCSEHLIVEKVFPADDGGES